MLDRFLAYCSSVKNLSPATIASYRRDIEQFLSFLEERGLSESDIERRTVRDFLSELTRRELATATVNRMLSALRRYFEYQVRYEKRATNPFAAVRSLKRDQRLPDFFFEEEMEQLLALPDESFLGKRDRAILELLYSTGCRVAELVSINISGLNYKRQSIRIVGKGNKERFVFIGREAMRALDAYLLVREEHVDRNDPDAVQALFINSRGGRITTRGVFYIIRKYIEMAGVPKKVGPHTFRHSFATHVLDRGADIRAVQELLGHSSLSTTQVYTHLGLDRLKKIYRKAHPHARKRSMT